MTQHAAQRRAAPPAPRDGGPALWSPGVLPAPAATPSPGLPPTPAAAPSPGVFASYAAAKDEPLLVVVGHPPGPRITWVNRACADLLAYAPQELVGRPLDALAHSPFAPVAPDVAAEDGPWVDPVRTLDRAVTVERRDGSKLRLDASSVPVEAPGEPPTWVVRLRAQPDVARVEEDLQAARQRFRALSERAPIGIFSSESGLRLGYVNDRFCHLLGERAEQLLGTEWLRFLHEQDLEPALAALGRVLQGEAVELPLRLVRRDGDLCHVQARVVPVTTSGRGAGFLGTLEDVTQRLAWEQTMAYQARHDPLTGLPNRRQLLEVLTRRLGETGDERAVSLLFLDLDDFKQVNDSLGHTAGDLLLTATAERLARSVRAQDLVARFGGDEFAVLCPGVGDERAATEIAERLLQELTAPLSIGSAEVGVAASVGVVVADLRHVTADQLLRDADAAMYQAKSAGRNTWALFDEGARLRTAERLALVADLRAALSAGELEVAYQPVVSVPVAVGGSDGRGTVSVEALVRWRHPERGPVPPDEFVPLAEEHGLVVELGEQVLRTACAQMVAWTQAMGDLAPAAVSVNVSPLQLRQGDFVATVATVLRETGLPGTRLTLELTETVVMQDPDAAAVAFRALRALGVRVAIDDFGTGYSSLALLRDLPLDQLKIDRSFLRDLERLGDDPIVSAVVALADSLGLVAVAEGVETEEQMAELHRLGCPLAQGYLVSRPLSPEALARLLLTASGADVDPAGDALVPA